MGSEIVDFILVTCVAVGAGVVVLDYNRLRWDYVFPYAPQLLVRVLLNAFVSAALWFSAWVFAYKFVMGVI